MSSEHDICPVCGKPVKRQNLLRHYRKVHPRRLESLERSPEPSLSRRPRIRHPRRALFYVLVIVAVTIISVVAVQVISVNTIRMRIQPQLSILIRGVQYPIPSGIGIEQTLWRDHSLDRYGIWGTSPLKTRDSSGTIYVESNTVRNFTLHEFLAIWGVSVDYSQVVGNSVQSGESACTVVNGQATTITDAVVFIDQEKIALDIISGSCSALA